MYNQEVRTKIKLSLIEKINEWVEHEGENIDIYFSENTVSLLAENILITLEAIKESGEEQELNAD